MSFITLLKQQLLLDHTIYTLPFLLLTSLLWLITYKTITRKLLNTKKFSLYIIIRPLMLSSLLFAWFCATSLFLFLKVDKNLLANKYANRLENISNIYMLGFFIIFFISFLIGSIKNTFVQLPLIKLKKTNLDKVIRFSNISLFLWFIFLVIKCFDNPSSTSIDSETTSNLALSAQKILISYTLWCFVLIVAYAFYTFSSYYRKKLEQRKQHITYVLLKGITWPIIILLLGSMLLYTLSLFIQSPKLSNAYSYFSFCCVLFALFQLIGLFEKHFLDSKVKGVDRNKTLVQGLGNIARIILAIIFAIVLLVFFSGKKMFDLGTLLGGTGFGIVVVARPIIANYLGGLVLYAEGNFKVGDMISFTEKKIEGFIEHIGPRSIGIRTFDKRLLFVPNAWFSSESVVNASQMTHRRILKNIPIGWITNLKTLDKIVQDIRIVVNNHPGIDKTQLLMVHFTGYNQQGLEITICAFTKTKSLHMFRNVQENILREAKAIIEKHAGSPPTHLLHHSPTTQEST